MFAIETMALGAHPGMPAFKEILAQHFPKKDYDTQLVWNIINKKREAVYGKGRHQMGELMELGNRVSANGGIWVPDIDAAMRLVGCDYQTPQMREYSLNFGSYFSTVDGTAKTNQDNLTNCPFVCTCSLGVSHVCGTGLYPSESSPKIIKSAQLFAIASIPAEGDDKYDNVSN